MICLYIMEYYLAIKLPWDYGVKCIELQNDRGIRTLRGHLV